MRLLNRLSSAIIRWLVGDMNGYSPGTTILTRPTLQATGSNLWDFWVILSACGSNVIFGPIVIASWILNLYLFESHVIGEPMSTENHKLTIAAFVLTLSAFIMPSQLFTSATHELILRMNARKLWAEKARNLPEFIVALVCAFMGHGSFYKAFTAGIVVRDLSLTAGIVLVVGDTNGARLNLIDDKPLLILAVFILPVVPWLSELSPQEDSINPDMSIGLSFMSFIAISLWLYYLQDVAARREDVFFTILLYGMPTPPEGPESPRDATSAAAEAGFTTLHQRRSHGTVSFNPPSQSFSVSDPDYSVRGFARDNRPRQISETAIASIAVISGIFIVINSIFFFSALDVFVQETHIPESAIGTFFLPLIFLLGERDAVGRACTYAIKGELTFAISLLNGGAIFATLVIYPCATLLAWMVSGEELLTHRLSVGHSVSILVSIITMLCIALLELRVLWGYVMFACYALVLIAWCIFELIIAHYDTHAATPSIFTAVLSSAAMAAVTTFAVSAWTSAIQATS